MDDPGYALLALVFLLWLFSLLIRLVLLIIRVVLWLVMWTMRTMLRPWRSPAGVQIRAGRIGQQAKRAFDVQPEDLEFECAELAVVAPDLARRRFQQQPGFQHCVFTHTSYY